MKIPEDKIELMLAEIRGLLIQDFYFLDFSELCELEEDFHDVVYNVLHNNKIEKEEL